METVIVAEHLGKTYQRALDGGALRYRVLRDLIAGAIPSPGARRSAQPRSETFAALEDVNFRIQRGETVGLIGRNGSGKSTLLKILSRIVRPSSGRVGVAGRIGSLLEVGTGFHPELTGRENIFMNGAVLGMRRQEIAKVFDAIVAFSGVERQLDVAAKRYSSGMFMKLAFSVAAHLETEILLLDEVLAVGDLAFQQKCFEKIGGLAQSGRTTLLVSHNLHAIRSTCARCLLLDAGKLAAEGTTSGIASLYERQCLNGSSEEHPVGVLYEHPGTVENSRDIVFQRIETLDERGQRLPTVATWQYVRIRISVWSPRHVPQAAVELRLRGSLAEQVMRLSTMPDSNQAWQLAPGVNQIDCEIPVLYLAAGDFTLSAGVAVPKEEWLVPLTEIGMLTVQPANVFRSAFLSPAAPESLIAIPHTWIPAG